MDRSNVVVICVDNDPEARLICELTERMGMKLIRSDQAHGASLDKEPHVLRRLRKAGDKRVVWAVEIPGPRTEREMANRGYALTIIDHHEYGTEMDRSKDEAGQRLPSSLEQFLSLAEVSDQELAGWGYDPKTFRGIGIMDDRYVRGLKDAGYAPDELGRVLDLRNELWAQLRPDHDEIVAEAKRVWETRESWNGYVVMTSKGPLAVRGEISMCSVRQGLDEQPFVLSEREGSMLYVQNVAAEVVGRLQQAFTRDSKHKYKTFVFGAGRCWGMNCQQGPRPDLSVVLDVLKPL